MTDGEDDTGALLEKICRQSRYLDQMRNEKFDLEHRIRNLTRALGFNSLEEAEESQSQCGPLSRTSLEHATKRIEILEAQALIDLANHEQDVAALSSDLRRAEEDNSRLTSQSNQTSLQLQSTLAEMARMREEHREHLATKDTVIANLRRANPPIHAVPSEEKENRALTVLGSSGSNASPLPMKDSDQSLRPLYEQLRQKHDLLTKDLRHVNVKFAKYLNRWKGFKTWFHLSYGRTGDSEPPTKKRRRSSVSNADLDAEVHRTLDDLIRSGEKAIVSTHLAPMSESSPSRPPLGIQATDTAKIIDLTHSSPSPVASPVLLSPNRSRYPLANGNIFDGLDMTPDTPNHIDAKVSISSELSPNPKHETKLSRASIPASEPRVSVAKLLPELGQISNKRHSIGGSKYPRSISAAQPVAGSSKTPHAILGPERKAVRSEPKSKPPQEDYLRYKGRGRYARAIDVEDDSTANYEIDTSRNGGINHPFDAVVRKRKDRQQLHAGDCECCRDYYEAVGPLPARLAAPLWKSPSPASSPSSSLKRRSMSPEAPEHAEIQNRKQQISRHRHNWAPASTPPDYWHIGFPDTQQVESINRRAEEMNTAKKKRIEQEARKPDGKYKRKKSI